MADPDDPLVGQVLDGRFEVGQLIDRGGMGKIYKAIQRPLGRTVALKTLDKPEANGGEFTKRFLQEASVCARLTHANTVRIFDYGTTESGVIFLVMEFLEGRQLQDCLEKEAPLAPARAIRIARQIAQALTEAHDHGVVHRDLKPANVFLTRHGDDGDFVKVVDFGAAKQLEADMELSMVGTVLGSPMYMSPEQAEAIAVDVRTDIYSLGLLLYVMLCGKTPFKHGSSLSIMLQQVHKVPATFAEIAPDVAVLPSLEWVVRTCIQKDRTQRFASMREVVRALAVVDRELAGQLRGPVAMKLDNNGVLVLPPGVEELSEADRERSMSGARALATNPRTNTAELRPLTVGLASIALVALGALAALAVVLVGAWLYLSHA